ncbi:MAG TPA: hypothetical protein VK996_15875 [Ramlibacter sp.]|nr:hypothetical protein [Ramlibacter sp.]
MFASRLLLVAACLAGPLQAAELPRLLSETGLFAKGSITQVRAGIVTFSPQYPLWSDGAEKRRWMLLPPGTHIDATRPGAWQFPRGTRLWKEFAHDGRPVETRFIERVADGSWRFASYVWNEDGSDAVLAPAAGYRSMPVRAAPGGRYAIPSRTDCLACHASTTVPVLGVSALQLSPDRDPLAPGAKPQRAGDVDLRSLVSRGWLRGLPHALLDQPPRIPASTPVERAALGYLHGNCSHCHNTTGSQAPVGLTLAQRVGDPSVALKEVLRSMLDAASRYRPEGAAGDAKVVAPGRAENSVLAIRMQSRNPQAQMPPLGTAMPDPDALALVYRWINNDLSQPKETSP